jgi:hypothetical protein
METQTLHKNKKYTPDEKAELVSFSKPVETRRFPLGKLDLVNIGGATIGRGIFEPGWRWSTSVKPIAKTESCEAPHFQYHLSGVLRIIMDDGTTFDAKPGDVTLLPAGHDAYVIGDEAVVVIDFQGMIDYAKSK